MPTMTGRRPSREQHHSRDERSLAAQGGAWRAGQVWVIGPPGDEVSRPSFRTAAPRRRHLAQRRSDVGEGVGEQASRSVGMVVREQTGCSHHVAAVDGDPWPRRHLPASRVVGDRREHAARSRSGEAWRNTPAGDHDGDVRQVAPGRAAVDGVGRAGVAAQRDVERETAPACPSISRSASVTGATRVVVTALRRGVDRRARRPRRASPRARRRRRRWRSSASRESPSTVAAPHHLDHLAVQRRLLGVGREPVDVRGRTADVDERTSPTTGVGGCSTPARTRSGVAPPHEPREPRDPP